ncbi:MAG: FAD-dependent oxidoreductase [Anaerolineales bacterium]|nr:FAD-dependent oxidoreductase [Anaerolineales bacterium]
MRSPDVLIIGAGVIGLSIAWSQAQQGARVLVIDPFPGMGCGASGAASGILLPPIGRRQQTIWGQRQHLAWQQWPVWRYAVESASGIDIGWMPCGALRFMAHRPRQLGPDQRWHADGRALEPVLAAIAPPYGALETPRGGHIQPLALLAALHAAVRSAGGQVQTTSIWRLIRLTACPAIVTAYTVDHQRICARLIVVAAGEQTAALVEPLGIRLSLTRDAGAILHVRQVPRPSRLICRERVTAAAKPDGTVVITGAHWGDVAPRLTLERLADLWEGATHALGDSGVVHGAWTGVRVRGPQGYPVIGRVDGVNLAIATGFGSQGYLLAPIVGTLLDTPLDPERLTTPVSSPSAALGAAHDGESGLGNGSTGVECDDAAQGIDTATMNASMEARNSGMT